MRKAGTELIVTKDSWNCCVVLKMIVFLFHIFCCFWSMFTGGGWGGREYFPGFSVSLPLGT